MRGFLIFCLITACAAAQLGYNYPSAGQDVAFGSSGSFAGGSIGSFGSFGSTGSGGSLGFGGGIVDGTNSGFGGFAGSHDAGSYSGGSLGSNGISTGSGFDSAPITEYNKEFYSYSAPEEEFHDHSGAQQLSSSLKKNLRVVFIKTPENQGLTNAALQLAKQASDDRTAIYVLSKQTDIGELANKLQTIQSSNANKPEVHFVKYRTPEDAARAQQTIQNQYNALGGSTITSNEGVAPVLNFASAGGYGGGVGLSTAAYVPPKASYLPPARRVK